MTRGERLAFSLWGRREVTGAGNAGDGGANGPAGPPSPPPANARPEGRADAEKPEPRDWAFTWTLIFTGVLFLRPQDVFRPLEVLHLAELSAIAGLVSLFVGRLARRQSLTRMTPEFAGVLALGAIILMTAPFSIWFGGAVGVFTDVYLKVALVYLLAVNVLISPKRIERLTWLLVLAIGYLAFRAVFDYARGVNMLSRGTRVRGSVGGLMENPNDLALHMVVFLPLAVFMAMRPGPVIKRLIAAGAGACMLGAIVASGSRGGFVGFAVMAVVMAGYAIRQRPILAVVGLFAVMCALPLVPDQYWRRVASITDESKDDYESSQARKRLFGEAFTAFLENPITGVGAGQFKDYKPEARVEAWSETHNIWLQVAAELGVFGLAVFGFLMARAFSAVAHSRRLLRRSRAALAAARRPSGSHRAVPAAPALSPDEALMLDGHSAAMAASLVGFFVCAFFSSVAYTWTFYYLLALAAAPRDILRARVPAAARSARAAAPAPVLPELNPRGVRV